jgi:hemoglobin-like flavoprotein
MPVRLHPLYRDEPPSRLVGVGRDQAVIERLRSQYRLVRAQGERLASLFYERLFLEYPAVRPLFHEDPQRQRLKLMDSLDTVIGFLDQPSNQREYLRQMGARHMGYGALPAHYEVVSGLLADAMVEVLGDQVDQETRNDWLDAFRLISDQMLAGASQRGPDSTD